MTVAVVILDRKAGKVVLGADTELWSGNVRFQGPSKVVQGVEGGGWAAAASGATWSGEMMLACRADADDPHHFRTAIVKWTKDAGHGSTEAGRWTAPWSVLLINPRGAWEIAADGAVLAAPGNYIAVGSGAPVAYGALHALHVLRFEVEPAVRVKLALEAAAAHSDGVGGPFDVVTIDLAVVP